MLVLSLFRSTVAAYCRSTVAYYGYTYIIFREKLVSANFVADSRCNPITCQYLNSRQILSLLCSAQRGRGLGIVTEATGSHLGACPEGEGGGGDRITEQCGGVTCERGGANGGDLL